MESNRINLKYKDVEHIDTLERLVLEASQVLKIPMFCSVAIFNDEHTTKYLNVVYGCQSHSIFLTNDMIRNHMLIADGFEVAAKGKDKASLKIAPRKTMISPSDDEIKMLTRSIERLYDKCVELNVPCFITAAISNNESETKYITKVFKGNGGMADGKPLSVHLTKDHILKHIKVVDGFVAVPERNITTIDLEGVLYGIEDEEQLQ